MKEEAKSKHRDKRRRRRNKKENERKKMEDEAWENDECPPTRFLPIIYLEDNTLKEESERKRVKQTRRRRR